MMWWGHGFGMGGWLMGGLMMLLFWVVVAVLVVLLVRAFGHSRAGGEIGSGASQVASNDRALQIAQERYARGEITREEYEEIRQTLRG